MSTLNDLTQAVEKERSENVIVYLEGLYRNYQESATMCQKLGLGTLNEHYANSCVQMFLLDQEIRRLKLEALVPKTPPPPPPPVQERKKKKQSSLKPS